MGNERTVTTAQPSGPGIDGPAADELLDAELLVGKSPSMVCAASTEAPGRPPLPAPISG